MDEDGVPISTRGIYFIAARSNASFADMSREYNMQLPPLIIRRETQFVQWSTVYTHDGNVRGVLCPECVVCRVRAYAFNDSDCDDF